MGSGVIDPAAQIHWIPILKGKRKKLKKQTARDKLDALIDWYEKNQPDHPKEIPGGVSIKPTALDRWASQWETRDGCIAGGC